MRYSYSELLKRRGIQAVSYIPVEFNNSITPAIKKWNFDFQKDLPDEDCDFIVMDVSNPKYFPREVRIDKVIEIFDHHYGFEDFWKEKIGDKSHIEMIGSCATLIVEEFEKDNLLDSISGTSANLLYTAVVSNTLNFNASVTTKRDVKAFEKLKRYTDLPSDWVSRYFSDQAQSIVKNLRNGIKNDTKTEYFDSINRELVIGQLELWHSLDFINHRRNEIKEVLTGFGKRHWFLTSPSIGDGYNIFYTDSEETKELLTKHFNVIFDGDLGRNSRLILRKEIIKILSGLKPVN